MQKKYYIFTAIAAYLLFLIATIPARPVIYLFKDSIPLSFQSVSGTLWNGNAYTIAVEDRVMLKNTTWSFNLWKLLIGQVAADIATEYADNLINAEAGLSFTGQYFVNSLTAEIPAENIAELIDIPLATLSGTIALNIDHAHWKQGELPVARGQINWTDAAVSITDTASLGNILISLGESANQLLNADIKNQGGDIAITGRAELVPEAGYAVNINLSPAATANNNIKQSLELFAKRLPNGSYLFNQTGQLSEIGLI